MNKYNGLKTSIVGKKRGYVRVDFDCDSNDIVKEMKDRRVEIEKRIFLDLLANKTKNIESNSKIIDMANKIISRPLECYKESSNIDPKYTLAAAIGDVILPFQTTRFIPVAKIGGTISCLAKDIYRKYFN